MSNFEIEFADLLNKTATIYRKSFSSVNSFGERDYSLSVVVSNLTCTIQPVREELSHTLHGTTYVIRDVVYCEYRTDILPGDIIEIDSSQYLIVSVQNDGGQNHHLKMYVTKAGVS